LCSILFVPQFFTLVFELAACGRRPHSA
jgi:hypothetical protein